MTAPQQAKKKDCRLFDQNDLIAFLKFAGFDVELAKCTDGMNEITVSGFDDTGDIWCIRSRPHTSTPQCPHWGINRIVPNDDNGEYSGFVDSWECCKPNNDTAIRKAEREKVMDLLKKNGYKGAVAFLKNPEKYDKSLRREP